MNFSDIVLGGTYIIDVFNGPNPWCTYSASMYKCVLKAKDPDIVSDIDRNMPFIVLDKHITGETKSCSVLLVVSQHGISTMFYASLNVPILSLTIDIEGA